MRSGVEIFNVCGCLARVHVGGQTSKASIPRYIAGNNITDPYSLHRHYDQSQTKSKSDFLATTTLPIAANFPCCPEFGDLSSFSPCTKTSDIQGSSRFKKGYDSRASLDSKYVAIVIHSYYAESIGSFKLDAALAE